MSKTLCSACQTENPADASFCSTCGSPVPTSLGGGKLVMVPAGSMNSPVTVKPTAHLFIASKADWEQELDQVHQFQGYPE